MHITENLVDGAGFDWANHNIDSTKCISIYCSLIRITEEINRYEVLKHRRNFIDFPSDMYYIILSSSTLVTNLNN